MIASDVAQEIARAAPEASVTCVLSWRLSELPGQPATSLLARISELKRPLLDRLGLVPDMRINPLPGMPQAIAMAPAQRWRDFLRDQFWLADSPDVEIAANRAVFHTQDATTAPPA